MEKLTIQIYFCPWNLKPFFLSASDITHIYDNPVFETINFWRSKLCFVCTKSHVMCFEIIIKACLLQKNHVNSKQETWIFRKIISRSFFTTRVWNSSMNGEVTIGITVCLIYLKIVYKFLKWNFHCENMEFSPVKTKYLPYQVHAL